MAKILNEAVNECFHLAERSISRSDCTDTWFESEWYTELNTIWRSDERDVILVPQSKARPSCRIIRYIDTAALASNEVLTMRDDITGRDTVIRESLNKPFVLEDWQVSVSSRPWVPITQSSSNQPLLHLDQFINMIARQQNRLPRWTDKPNSHSLISQTYPRYKRPKISTLYLIFREDEDRSPNYHHVSPEIVVRGCVCMNLELRFNHYPACEIQIVQFGFSSNPLDIRSEYLSLAEKFDSLINSASLLSEFRCEPTPLSLPWELGQKQEQRVVPRSTTSRDGLKSDMEIDNYWARPAENVINRSAMLSEFMTPRQQDFSQISFFEPDFLSSESLRNDFGHTTIPSHETRESSLTIPYIAANFPTSATDSNVFAASKDKAHHSKQSWEDVRSTIEKLYREDGLSLAQVKNTMDNRGFIATEREYYPRLKRWGLTKNIRSEEMIVMYRKMIQRKAAEDKETKITLHGRPVDLRKISRFVKRVQLSPSQLPGQGTPVHILAFTPRSRSNHSSITFPWNQSPHKRFLQIARSNLAETASEEGSSKGGGSEDGDDLYDLSWLENMDIWRP